MKIFSTSLYVYSSCDELPRLYSRLAGDNNAKVMRIARNNFLFQQCENVLIKHQELETKQHLVFLIPGICSLVVRLSR